MSSNAIPCRRSSARCEVGGGWVAGLNANARMDWVREMTASVENDANRGAIAREAARKGLEVLAQAFGISIARRDHRRSWSFDDLQGKLQKLEESANRLRKMWGLNTEVLSREPKIRYSTELISALDEFYTALDESNLVDGGLIQNLPSDCVGQGVRDFDEELAERLLSESMDRLAIVAKDISDLAAETAVDLALIEAKRGQIDRAQTENWALLRELTGQAR